MKRSIFISLMCLVIVLIGIMPAFAASPESGSTLETQVKYEASKTEWLWSVPATQIFTDTNLTKTGDVSITPANSDNAIILDEGTTIDVSLSSSNEFKLKNTDKSAIPYEIKKGSTVLTNNDNVLHFEAGVSANTGIAQTLSFETTAAKVKEAKLTGQHTDVVMFNLAVTPGSGNSGGAGSGGGGLESVSGILPAGSSYYVGVTSTSVGDYSDATQTLLGGDAFPENVNDGDVFVYGDYEYRYNQCYRYSSSWAWISSTSQNGWGVRVLDTSKESYGEILSSINGKPVTNMENTFYKCTRLTTAPVIPSSITNMSDTFYKCTNLKTYADSTASDGDFSNYIIPNSVTNMSSTFMGCTNLTTAPVIPSSVTDMHYTFEGCKSLTSAPAIPSSVTNMFETFYECTSLTSAPDMSNASSVKNMYRTFSQCTSLTSAPVIPNSVTNMSHTFQGCTSLTTAPVIPNGVITMEGTFGACSSLTTAPVIPSSVTNMRSTFTYCTSLKGEITINANPTSYTDCFYKCAQDAEHAITLKGTSKVRSELKATGHNSGQYIRISSS